MTWKDKLFDTPALATAFMNASGITLAQTMPILNVGGQYVLWYYN